MANKKPFFSRHAKSSAAVVTLSIHAAILVIAFFFVAVTVIQRQETEFEAKPVNRPRMNLRKLQVPVNVKAPPPPKLRRQIVAAPKLKKVTPDIKMPEIVGVKGGVGAGAGSGFGRGDSLGFAMPEISFFGVKRKSERIFIILAGGADMSSDQLGGAYGFEVIKNECLKLIEGLPPTAMFNIAVYGETRVLFADMVSATSANVQKARDWLMPLNQVKGAKTKYGVDTLGPGGTAPAGNYPFGRFKEDVFYPRGWTEPVFEAMRQQADTVFLLTCDYGFFGYDMESTDELREKWNETSAGKDWNRKVAEGRKKLAEENAKRKAAGEPPSSLDGNSQLAVVRHYYPGTQEPPHGKRAFLGEMDLVDAFQEACKAYAAEAPSLGIQGKKKAGFSLNIIYFRPEKAENERAEEDMNKNSRQFSMITKALDGEFRTVEGLKAIESYIK